MIGIGVMCLVPIIVDLMYVEYTPLGFFIPALISICTGFILTEALKKYDTGKIRQSMG